MKESVVVDIDRNLLSDAIELAEKTNLSLSNYVSALLKQAIKYERGEIGCLQTPPDGVCLEVLPKNANLNVTLDTLEKKMIVRALGLSSNVKSNAARLLGISKSGLHHKMQKYKLKAEKFDLDNYRAGIDELLADGHSTKSIAKKYGIPEGQLLYWMSKKGI